jgi:hypothetical protein
LDDFDLTAGGVSIPFLQYLSIRKVIFFTNSSSCSYIQLLVQDAIFAARNQSAIIVEYRASGKSLFSLVSSLFSFNMPCMLFIC